MKKCILFLTVTIFSVLSHAYGQPANYYMNPSFGSPGTFNLNNPTGGIENRLIQATSTSTAFSIDWDSQFNEWYNGNISLNQEFILIWHAGSGLNYTSNINAAPIIGKYYTLQIRGLSYSNRQAVIMETDNPLQSFHANPTTAVSTPTNVVFQQAATIDITLAGNKSPQEKVFVRYSKNDFASSKVVEAFGTGNLWSSASATIPATENTAGTVKYYAYTTTVSATDASDHDLITLKFGNNAGSNYSYTVAAPVTSTTTGGLWSSNTTWVGNVVPTSGQAVVIDGTSVTLDQDGVTVGSLTINSGKVLNINSNKSLTVAVNGALTNSASATGLVIESGGSLITNGTVAGSATVKREITSDFKWHFLSSPVSGQIICDGNFAPLAANFNAGTGATYDFYKWSEPVVAGNLNWINLKNTDWTLNIAEFGATPVFDVAKGYLVAYGPSFAGSSTKSFAGIPTTGDQTVTLTTGGNKWNLIGNPFASAINWDVVTKTSLVDGYYNVYNENKSGGAGYEYYLDGTHKSSGANGKIAATQGFFVKASGASIVLPNAARVHDNNWMKNTEVISVDQLLLKLSHGNNYDEAFIQFEAQGTTGKDFFDAEKMFSFSSEIPQVYTTIENEIKIAFNSMPLNSELFSIPLGVYIPADGDYVLDILNIQGLTNSAGVILEDLKINVLQDLNSDPLYQFTAAVNDDPDRFLLHFGTVGISTPNQENPAVIYSHGGIIFVTGAPANAEITVSNLTGQIMLQGKSAGNSLTSLNAATLPKGIYLVSVLSNGQLTSRKVVL